MIPADIEQKILRLHFVERWPIGTIARHCAIHHTTVRRVLRDRGLSDKSAQRPRMVDPFLPFIHETFEKYPDLPASRLHAMIAERGYTGSASHFRRVASQLRPRKPAEAFQRLRTLSGEEAQVDWGHFGHQKVGHATRALSAFVMVLSWSRMPFVSFFYDQRMTSFLHGHIAAFEFFGGVPRRLLYDNLKSAVTERRGDAIRYNPTLLDFAAHYRFEPRAVAIRRGNEKGRVERTIRYMRTSFWPARHFKDLDDLNVQAIDWCRKIAGGRPCPEDRTLSVGEAFAEEQPHLLALPGDVFPAEDSLPVRVGKQPYVRFETNDYSIPHDHVRRTLTLQVSPYRLRIIDGDDLIAEHIRSFSRGEQIEDPAHLKALTAWKKKARAGRGIDRLHHAVPSSTTLLEGAAQRGHNLGSAVAALLRLVESWGSEAVESAVLAALSADTLHVGAVRQVLDQRAQAASQPPPLSLHLPDDPRLQQPVVRPHALSGYDLEGDR